jgi:hypothetical protein
MISQLNNPIGSSNEPVIFYFFSYHAIDHLNFPDGHFAVIGHLNFIVYLLLGTCVHGCLICSRLMFIHSCAVLSFVFLVLLAIPGVAISCLRFPNEYTQLEHIMLEHSGR